MRRILLCTVGGSHQPILTAIRELAPDYVFFVCTGRDPGTGRAGSEQQIVGKGPVIKPKPEDEKPSLPNIPSQLGLAEEQFETLLVPSDDLDKAFVEIDRKLRLLQERFPAARLVADYTGGTKTMTAALVAAALEHPRVELEIVTGNRANLVRVLDGTQYAAPASVDGIRIGRAIAAHVAAWERFAYDEAAQGLGRIVAPGAGELRPNLNRARDLSVAFAAWDRFDHREALRLIDNYAQIVGERMPLHLQALRVLT
jgi:CRISPR-associated protein (TIGR02710 family)